VIEPQPVPAASLPEGGIDGRVVVLAGPGVIDDGAVEGLRSFAAAGDLGVANTWGAKGVFNWDSPHHLGTCGLQERDFELLGFARADAIVATGIDPDESPLERFALAPVFDLAPRDLERAAGRVRATGDPLPNELYAQLAAVAQPGYADTKVPLHPARAVADLGAVLPPGGLLAADPGVAGLWVARTFPTPALMPGEPRRVVVPARGQPGIAATLALDAARAGRPAIAVTAAPLADVHTTVVEHARAEGVHLVVVVWSREGHLRVAEEHRERIIGALSGPRAAVVEVPVALDDTAALTRAAGTVVAWGGLA
jgi:thiamine pyrophosphate-dependent acetolactate synthase large subunit-like protein